MKRIIYIAGRYRHKHADGTPNLPAMAAELQAEANWVELIADCGHGWIAPLHNSKMLAGLVPDRRFIEMDIEILARLHPGRDCILMRPGWDSEPVSEGAMAEYEAAKDHGLIVLYGMHGMEQARQALQAMDAEDAENIAEMDATRPDPTIAWNMRRWAFGRD